MESDPWAEDGGLEFLFGVLEGGRRQSEIHAVLGA